MSVLFTLADAVRMTDECRISVPLFRTVDIIRDPGQTEGLVQKLD